MNELNYLEYLNDTPIILQQKTIIFSKKSEKSSFPETLILSQMMNA